MAEERTAMGCYMGSAVPRRDLPRFIAMYQAGLLPVDRLADGVGIGQVVVNRIAPAT